MKQPSEAFKTTEEKRHIEAREAAKVLLGFPPGITFLKQLFRIGGVGTLPDEGLVQDFLRSEIGRLKLGREIYQLVSEADPERAALVLAEIEKERQDVKT